MSDKPHQVTDMRFSETHPAHVRAPGPARVVYVESYDSEEAAQTRLKRLSRWSRAARAALVLATNPRWEPLDRPAEGA